MTLGNRNILLGVTGGVAAFKVPLLVRHWRFEAANVQVVLTPGAERFVTRTTMQAVSGRPVRTSLWDEAAEAAMSHIELARWAHLVVVAPATAHFMACLAQGLAPNLLATLCLAADAPILLAPAMNQAMWRDPTTERNLATLRADGRRIIGPNEGEQACGDVGLGRMAEPEELLAASRRLLSPPCLQGLDVLVTAGPTQEAWDPVRYLSNHSSGKQGYAIAEAAAIAGARTTLVSGPCSLPIPAGVQRIEATSAQQMHEAVLVRAPSQALVIGVAAVADYRPANPAEQKMKKDANGQEVTLSLVENPDIIGSVAALPNGPVVVGFAAETENALANAQQKRAQKGLDAIVMNDVSDQAIGFDSNYNAATLIWADGRVELPQQTKQALAADLIERLAALFFPNIQAAGNRLTARAPKAAEFNKRQ